MLDKYEKAAVNTMNILFQVTKFKFLEFFIDSIFTKLYLNLNLIHPKSIKFKDVYNGMNLKEIKITGIDGINTELQQLTNISIMEKTNDFLVFLHVPDNHKYTIDFNNVITPSNADQFLTFIPY